MPQVSIIIPAFNQARYLGAAIESALGQTYPDLEVIVVDDGSTDGTEAVAQSISDPRLRYTRQANAGLSAARNTGIRLSRGAYLSFLDSDDLFLADKLDGLMAALGSDRQVGLAAGQAIPIDELGRPAGRIFDVPLPEVPARLVLRNPLHVGSVLVRTEWQERAGWFDERLRSYEDWDMWLRLARAGCGMRWVARPVSCYRFHDLQMTRDGEQMTGASMAVLDKLYADPELPQAWLDLKSEAYSRAHLRAAANDYLSGRFARANEHVTHSIRLDPSLAEDHARRLRQHISSWIDLPKAQDRMAFLKTVYAHLPVAIASPAERRLDLGQAAERMAREADRQGDRPLARKAIWTAVRTSPRRLLDRGVLSILVRSLFTLSAGTSSEPAKDTGSATRPSA